MAWRVIRKATEEDYERLGSAAERFAVRHGIRLPYDCTRRWAGWEVGMELTPSRYEVPTEERRRLRQLWRRVVRRALHSRTAEGIAYDTVGYSTD
jgi:hypothetical protein